MRVPCEQIQINVLCTHTLYSWFVRFGINTNGEFHLKLTSPVVASYAILHFNIIYQIEQMHVQLTKIVSKNNTVHNDHQ